MFRIESKRQRPIGAHPVYWVSTRLAPPSDWTVKAVGELASAYKGKLPSITIERPTDRSKPYLLMEGLRGGTYIFTEETHLPSVSEVDTIVIADGSKSGFAIRGIAGVLGSTLLGFKVWKENNSGYFYHLLSSLYPLLASTTTGTAIPHLDQNLLFKLSIAIPSPDEQAAIARILDAVDTAIERTRGTVERARQLRKSLIAELLSFGVDTNGQVRDSIGAAKQIARTPLGLLPIKWRLSTVGAEFDLQNGFTLNENRRPRYLKRRYLRVANVQRDALMLDDIQELEASDAQFAPRVLEVNDLLVVEGHADRMQIGRCAKVTEEAQGLTFQNHLFRLRTSGDVLPYFGCLWLNSTHAQRYWNARCATSSGLNTINQRMLKRLIVPVPPKHEQQIIADVVSAQRTHLESLVAKWQSLESLKKSLMHDLLTGKVRVDFSHLLSDCVGET